MSDVGGSIVLVSGPVDETGSTANTVDGDIATGWHASVLNNDTSVRSYRVFALCSANSDATVEETTFDLTAWSAADAVAACPPGRRAVGGGIGTMGATLDAYLRASGPVDETGLIAGTADGDIAKGWYASVFSSAPTRTYRVFALCSATSDATIEETRFDLAARSAGGAFAACPAGKWATGGGVGTTASTADSAVRLSGPIDETGQVVLSGHGDVAKYWYANVENLSDPRGYTVAAICAGDDLSPRVSATPTAPPRASTPLRAPRPACVIPRLRGKRLAAAKRAIRRARCRVGKVRRRYTRRVRKGRVISQSPRSHTVRRPGSKVTLVVSRGPRRGR